MAVVSFTARAFGATGSGSLTQDAGGSIVELKRFRSTWRAQCDSPSDDPQIVFKFLSDNQGTYPWYDKTYSYGNGSDQTARLKTIDIDVVDQSNRLFDVVFGYEPIKADAQASEPQQGTGGELTANPLDWLEDIDVYFTQTLQTAERGLFHGFFSETAKASHPVMFDGQKIPITNSAQTPYDPPLETEKQIKIIRISRNVPEYDGPFFDTYQGSINSDLIVINKPFYRFRHTIAPLTGKITIGGTFRIANGIKHWRQTSEIHIDYDNWRNKLLDKGNEFIEPESGETSGTDFPDNRKTIKDADGYPAAAPQLLDGTGRLLADGKPAFYGHWTPTGINEVPWAALTGKAW